MDNKFININISSNNNTNTAKNDFSYKKLTSDLNDMLPNGKEHERVEAMFAKLTAPQAARTTTAQSTLSTPAAMTAAKPTPPPPPKSTPQTKQTTKKRKIIDDKRAALALSIVKNKKLQMITKEMNKK